jgi:hypothetical protein
MTSPRISKIIGELWEAIRADVKPGREQSLALTKLDECSMWIDRSNVSILDALKPSGGAFVGVGGPRDVMHDFHHNHGVGEHGKEPCPACASISQRDRE